MIEQDNKTIEDFIKLLTVSIEKLTKEAIKVQNEVPDTITLLLKNPQGEFVYDGGVLPKDNVGKLIHEQIIEERVNEFGYTVFCRCETFCSKDTLVIKFTNKLNDEEKQFIFSLRESKVIQAPSTISYMGSTISNN